MANSGTLVTVLATLAGFAWLIAIGVLFTKHILAVNAKEKQPKSLKDSNPAVLADLENGGSPGSSPQVDNPLTSRRYGPDQSPVSSRWSRDSRFGIFLPRNARSRLEAAIRNARMTGSSTSNSHTAPSIEAAATPVVGSSSNDMNRTFGGGTPLTLPPYSPPPPSYKTQVSRSDVVDLEAGMVDVPL